MSHITEELCKELQHINTDLRKFKQEYLLIETITPQNAEKFVFSMESKPYYRNCYPISICKQMISYYDAKIEEVNGYAADNVAALLKLNDNGISKNSFAYRHVGDSIHRLTKFVIPDKEGAQKRWMGYLEHANKSVEDLENEAYEIEEALSVLKSE